MFSSPARLSVSVISVLQSISPSHLAAASGWNEPSFLTAFRQGLNFRLRLHLAAYDDTYGLEKFIQLAIRCSNRLQSCSVESSVAFATPLICQPEISDPPEPMQKRTTTAYHLRRDEDDFPMVCLCIVVRVGTGSWSVPIVGWCSMIPTFPGGQDKS